MTDKSGFSTASKLYIAMKDIKMAEKDASWDAELAKKDAEMARKDAEMEAIKSQMAEMVKTMKNIQQQPLAGSFASAAEIAASTSGFVPESS